MTKKFVNIVGPFYLNMSGFVLNVDQNIKSQKRVKVPLINHNFRAAHKVGTYHSNETLSH